MSVFGNGVLLFTSRGLRADMILHDGASAAPPHRGVFCNRAVIDATQNADAALTGLIQTSSTRRAAALRVLLLN